MGREDDSEDAARQRRAKFLEPTLARFFLDQISQRSIVRRDRGLTQVVLQPVGAIGKRLGRQLLHDALEAVDIDLAAVHPQRQVQCKQQDRIAERVGRRLRPHPIQNRAEHRGVDRAGRKYRHFTAMLAEEKSYGTRSCGGYLLTCPIDDARFNRLYFGATRSAREQQVGDRRIDQAG